MKGGDAVILKLAAGIPEPVRDVTYILYECEEIDAEFNGLHKLSQSHPEVMQADFAILMEPSNAEVEAGCQGTLRVEVRTAGERAHSARSWMGVNAIHGAVADPRPAQRRTSRASRSSTAWSTTRGSTRSAIRGGVAGNVLPDECVVEVNHRFAPDRSEEEAQAYVREIFDGYEVTVTRQRSGCPARARPAGRQGLHRGGRARGEPQVRVDRRRPLHRPRHPGGELRPGRPDARPQAGGVRARGAPGALRAAADRNG